MGKIFIVQVHPADGWGEDCFYCYYSFNNAREKIRQIAGMCEFELLVAIIPTEECSGHVDIFDENGVFLTDVEL